MASTALSPSLVLEAYANGYFPMWDPETKETQWFRPNPRAILPLDRFHQSRSLTRVIRRGSFRVSFNTCFEKIMRACADREETWISEEFISVYTEIHQRGSAHSVEVWKDAELAGGLYGVSVGGAFFAESKFHRKTDASKVALAALVTQLRTSGFSLLEVQFLTPHLQKLGAITIPDHTYIKMLELAISQKVRFLNP